MNNEEYDNFWDKSLGIKTTGRDATNANYKYFPYEPTPYQVLKRLAQSGYITKKNTILDYGCGKGRVSIFFTNQTKCKSIGIEYDKRLYDKAVSNTLNLTYKDKISFININALDYNITNNIDRCFFFNPFSIKIFDQIMNNIINSYNEFKREFLLFFYFPSQNYQDYLLNNKNVILIDEIDCSDIFNEEINREKIMIFKLTA